MRIFSRVNAYTSARSAAYVLCKRLKCLARCRLKRAGSGPKTLQDGSILAQLREVVVRAGGFEPPRPDKGLRIFIPLRLSPPSQASSSSGLSLHHSPYEV